MLGCSVNIHPNGVFYKNETLVSHDVRLFGIMCKRDVSDKDIDLSQKDVNKFKDEYRLWKEKGYLQTISFADNLNKHKGDFNKNNIRILKKHLKNTEYYLKKSYDETTNNFNTFIRIKYFIVLVFIKSLYNFYLLLVSTRLGKLIFKKNAYLIYSLLPDYLKYIIITNIKKMKS